MRHIRMPKTMRTQLGGQAELVAVTGEHLVHIHDPHPRLAFRRPQHRQRRPIERPDLGHPFVDDLDRPRKHRQHTAPPRRPTRLRLAPANRQHTRVTELRGLRIAAEVDGLEHRQLAPAQTPAVGDLQQRRITKRRQPPFAATRPHLPDTVVSVIEQRLQLDTGQRPVPRPTLELRTMLHRVPLMTDLHRERPEPRLALGGPAVAGVADVLAEQ